jgi:hypothetical protein
MRLGGETMGVMSRCTKGISTNLGRKGSTVNIGNSLQMANYVPNVSGEPVIR